MSSQLFEDNHDSWVMCATSTECKTVITAVLTVMIGIDPHLISGNIGMSNGHILGWDMSKWILLGCASVTVRLRDAIEASSLRR
jgi:hypothetical protein